MTAAQRSLVRDMHQKLCAEAGISDRTENVRAWHFQNCKGALYKTMLGDNPPKRKFVEGHSIYQWLPGGENEDPELVRLLELGDLEGFKERMRALFRDGRGREAPGTWDQAQINQPENEEDRRPYVRQIAYLFFAKKGDIVVMTSSGEYGDPALQRENTEYVVGVMTTEKVTWMTPGEMGVRKALPQTGGSVKLDGNSLDWRKIDTEGGQRVLQGDSAVREVNWLYEGKLYDCKARNYEARDYVSSLAITTIQPMKQFAKVLELFKKGSPIARKPAPPPPRAPRRAPPPRPQPADGVRIRVGAIVKATLHAWPGELKKLGSKFRARGRVVEQGTTDELDDDCPEELRKGRVWHVHYDVDDEIFPTPECCLSVVAPPRPPPVGPAAPATPDADRAPGAPVTPEDEDGPLARDPPGATAAAPGSIMATFQRQLSDTLWSKQQILSLMPNEQGSHIPAVYAAGGVIYALCFSEDANPSLPTVLEISCGAQRKRQVALLESLKQRGGTVPLFVCLQTECGRLELLPGGSGSKGFRFAGMRSVMSVQTHSTPKMVGGEARQATVTLSAPTAGGTCPLQVAGISRAIQVVGAPVTPEDDDDDEPEFIETRGSKRRARPSSTLRDKRDEEQAKVLKRVKKENRAAEKARDDAEKKKSAAEGKLEDAQELADQLVLSENNKMSEIDELRRTVSERDSRIEALETEVREKDATIAELRGRMGQLDNALAAVDAIRNRPLV